MESIDKVGRKKAARLDLRDLGKAQERKVREREAGHSNMQAQGSFRKFSHHI